MLAFFAAGSPPVVVDVWPVTVAEARAQLSIYGEEFDAQISGFIRAAASMIEGDTNTILRRRTFLDVFSNWSQFGYNRLQLARGPNVAITQITYRDADGVDQILDPALYTVSDVHGIANVFPAGIESFPSAQLNPASIRVEYEAGYADNDAVPADLKQAALVLIGHWFQNREAVITGTIASEAPLAYKALTRWHRIVRMG
jgi:uncharacterized phiE125 gp8 family phage protein